MIAAIFAGSKHVSPGELLDSAFPSLIEEQGCRNLTTQSKSDRKRTFDLDTEGWPELFVQARELRTVIEMYNGTVIIDAFDLPSHLRITWPRLEIQVQGTAISQLAGTVNFLASRLDMPSRVTGAGKRSSVTEVDALVELPIEEHGAASSENVTAAVEFKTCGQFRVRRGRTIADIFGNEEELGWVLPGLQQVLPCAMCTLPSIM